VPFLPSRVGLGSDLLRDNPRLRTVRSPYPSRPARPSGVGSGQPGVGSGDHGDSDSDNDNDGEAQGEELIAMPAFELDAALCHLNRADPRGNAMFLGPDLYWDDLMLQAAPTGRRFVSTERIVPTDQLAAEGCIHQMRISRMMVDGVIEAPGGAHFTSCVPDYGRDEAFQKEYAASAKSPGAWAEFRARWVDIPEADYQRRRNEQAEAAR
jgi:glutaconate CoA-transferase subunit A